ncbi:MAG TPA: UPF0182 family protein [Mycobacteriales bacterium]
MPPFPPVHFGRLPPRRVAIIGGIVAAIVVLLILLATVGTSLYVNLLFYRSIGFSNVFATQVWTRLVLFVIFAIVGAAAAAVNLVLAYRLRPSYVPMSAEQRQLEAYRTSAAALRIPLLVVVTVIVALSFGLSAQGRWKTVLLWLHGQSFGVKDPQFHRDIGYYTFTLPFERMVLGFGFAAVIVALVGAALVHYFYGGIRVQSPGQRFSSGARAHLSVLIGILLLLKSAAYWLDRFSLNFSSRGQVTGASYTDVHASLPAKTILVVVAIICAILFFANAIRPRLTLSAAGFLTMLLAALLVGGLFPALVQQFRVKPNAIDLESPYIARGIAATRAAYELNVQTATSPGNVKITTYNAPSQPAASAVTPAATNLANARLLDPNELQATFEQLQQIRSYYAFPQALDIDRYTIDGKEQSYVVATRGVNLAGIPTKNWPNEHLVYTHGEGFVAAETSQVDANGRPIFSVKGLPETGADGVSPPPITIDQPRIYFGELSPKYSVVDTKQPEVDGTGQADYHYTGDGGVDMGSKLGTRLAMALHFGDYNLLFSSTINKTSKILYNRDPRERVQKAAPWLTLDGDPYPAVVDGRIEWIVDGYTTTDDYPYSQRVSLSKATTTTATQAANVAKLGSTDVNYMRNSVKATVDAFTGKVTLYAFENGTPDPILRTWEKIFPGTVQPESSIPAALRAHFRYPEDLFNVQRNLLAKYHVTDPKAFFNGNGFWQVATDPVQNDTAQAPYYQEFQMPGESGPEFNLATSLTFIGRPNLAAFMAASSDPSDYGTIRILQLPDDTVIQGPANVENAIRSDSSFSPQYSLLNQQGSRVISGNLLTLPVGGGLVFVQPFYVQSNSTAGSAAESYPLLRYVVVVYGDKVGFAPTLTGAISAALSGGGGSATSPGGTSPPPSSSQAPPTSSPVSGTLAALEAAVQADFVAAQKALTAGDLGAYQAAVSKAQSDFSKLLAAGGTPPTGSITVTPSPTSTPSK